MCRTSGTTGIRTNSKIPQAIACGIFSFYLLQFLTTGLAQSKLSAAMCLQLLLRVKQADRHSPGFCLLTETVNMYNIRVPIDHKIAYGNYQQYILPALPVIMIIIV